MKTSWTMGALILPVLGALLLAGLPHGAMAGELAEAEVRLHDGRVLKGSLRQIQPSLYLVQTETLLCEITGAEIAAVNGTPGLPTLPGAGERLVRAAMYEVIRPNGDAELWTETQTVNTGSRVWTAISFGAAEHELDLIATLQAFDGHGNCLEHRISERPDRSYHEVTVDLVVPILPGEEVHLARRYLDAGRARREGDRYVLRFGGDFSEDRINCRKVQLPPGATVLLTDPEPTYRCEHQGAPILYWRRYYPRGARVPVTIEYRLPDRDAEGPD